LLGELLEGKLHEQFLWGGTGNGPSRKVRHRASSSPDEQFLVLTTRVMTRFIEKASNHLSLQTERRRREAAWEGMDQE
jgi:hypothetical protein